MISHFSAELTFQESVSKKNFYVCATAKKSDMPRHSVYIPSSVKSRLCRSATRQAARIKTFSY